MSYCTKYLDGLKCVDQRKPNVHSEMIEIRDHFVNSVIEMTNLIVLLWQKKKKSAYCAQKVHIKGCESCKQSLINYINQTCFNQLLCDLSHICNTNCNAA